MKTNTPFFKDCVNSAEAEVINAVLPETPIKNFVIKIINKNNKILGMYKHGTIWSTPLLILNEYVICREWKSNEVLSLYDIILTTMLHELAHAIQDYKGQYFDEYEAETFAHRYWICKTVLKI